MRRNFSRKREAILQALRSTKSHPTAEWLYIQLKAQYPDLSLGTVYRNLAEFKQEGLIQSVGTVDGQEHFDGDIAPHSHFICTACGSILDVAAPEDPSLLSAEIGEGVVTRCEIRYYGTCKSCMQGNPPSLDINSIS